MELPEWFTDKIAESVMGKKKYGRLYQREYDDVYYQTRDPIAAMQWAEKRAFAYAYGYFIGYAGAILNSSIPDQKTVKKLTRITGQSAESLRNLVAEDNKNHYTEDRESRLRKAIHSLSEDDLANLWNQCLKAVGYKEITPLRKTSDLLFSGNMPLGKLVRLYGRVFMKSDDSFSETPVSHYMAYDPEKDQYYPVLLVENYVNASWMAELILKRQVDVSEYPSLEKIVKES